MATTLYPVTGLSPMPAPSTFINPFSHTTAIPSGGSAPIQLILTTTAPGGGTAASFSQGGAIAFDTVLRAYSLPLSTAQTIGVQTVNCSVVGKESSIQENAEWEVDVFVWKNDNSGVRGNIGHTNGSFPEMSTTSSATTGSFTSTSVSAQAGDRICVEIYFNLTVARTGLSEQITYNSNSTSIAFATSTLTFRSELSVGSMGLHGVGI